MKAILALADGRVFTGKSFGATGEATGEVVFNTSMSGYQEVLTDPSYKGQMVTMTYTQIGNTGINPEDIESRGRFLSGFIVKEYHDYYSNWRATIPTSGAASSRKMRQPPKPIWSALLPVLPPSGKYRSSPPSLFSRSAGRGSRYASRSPIPGPT